MFRLHLDVSLSADEFIRVYQGTANRVYIRSREGRSVSLPARHLQPYLTREGIYGSFVLDFDQHGKLISLVPE